MAKRSTGLDKKRKTRNHKTKKRLEVKRERLQALAKKRGNK